METAQYWLQRQDRDLALADYMLTRDARHLAKIQEIDKLLLEQSLPDVFDDGSPQNVLTLARQQYIKLCAVLAEHYSQPENLTLVAFHAAVDYLSAKHHSE